MEEIQGIRADIRAEGPDVRVRGGGDSAQGSLSRSGSHRVRSAPRQEGTSRSPFEFKCFHYYYKWGRFGAVAMVITFSLYVQDLFWLCFECEPEIESKDTGDRGLKELRASMEGEALCGTIITRSIYLRCGEAVKLKELTFHDFTQENKPFHWLKFEPCS